MSKEDGNSKEGPNQPPGTDFIEPTTSHINLVCRRGAGEQEGVIAVTLEVGAEVLILTQQQATDIGVNFIRAGAYVFPEEKPRIVMPSQASLTH